MKTEVVSALGFGLESGGSEPGDRNPGGTSAQVAAELPKACAKAVDLLRAGEVVALPTETVYGLAADALHPIAVAKIFEAKKRPRFDPLIVHLPGREALDRIAVVESAVAGQLMEKFWPGPLTIVLKKKAVVPAIVTAGLDTVAVRMSAHPVFRRIVGALDRPLAAPSANRFGRISPTTAQHVVNELSGWIPLIIDAGPTQHGIESTIVRIEHEVIEVLRRGPITGEMLRPFAEVRECTPTDTVIAPGQLHTHYAPNTRLIIINNFSDFVAMPRKRVGALCFRSVGEVADSGPRPATTTAHFAAVRYLSERGDLREAAANLFKMLRELDAENLQLIVAERVPDEGVGLAINDRLERASDRGSD